MYLIIRKYYQARTIINEQFYCCCCCLCVYTFELMMLRVDKIFRFWSEWYVYSLFCGIGQRLPCLRSVNIVWVSSTTSVKPILLLETPPPLSTFSQQVSSSPSLSFCSITVQHSIHIYYVCYVLVAVDQPNILIAWATYSTYMIIGCNGNLSETIRKISERKTKKPKEFKCVNTWACAAQKVWAHRCKWAKVATTARVFHMIFVFLYIWLAHLTRHIHAHDNDNDEPYMCLARDQQPQNQTQMRTHNGQNRIGIPIGMKKKRRVKQMELSDSTRTTISKYGNQQRIKLQTNKKLLR